MPPEPSAADDAIPRARIEHQHGFSWIWLVPLAALVLVTYLGYTLVSRHGPLVSISFKTADGLTAKQTQVRYKAVTLGTVDSINLSDDSSHVVVSVRMTSEAEPLLTSQARFWVVRPQLTGGLSAIQSGLDALVSGAYVALDPGPKGGKEQRSFEGLEAPPSVRSDEPGTVYFLTARSVGGLSPGAPVYYRDVNVGELLSFELEQESVRLRIFVHTPYDRHIVAETRFWNSSGFSIDTGAEGLHVQLQSVRTLLSGGIAFRTPSDAEGRGAQHSPLGGLPQSSPGVRASRARNERAMSPALRHLSGVVLFATCALATCACSRSVDPVFYALAAQPGSAASIRSLKIELRRPGLPRYLDRPQIVRHATDERLALSSSDHWASPLDEMVAGTLADDLALRLPNCTVYAEGGAISVPPDVLVEIELSRFEETAPGTIELVAQVAVRFLKPVAPARLSRQTLRASTADRDTSQLVARLSTLLGQLSDTVAEQVVAGFQVEPKAPGSED